MALRMAMRYFILGLAIVLAGCASTPLTKTQTTKSNSKVNALPPQNLAVGECAFFGWSIGPDPRLIFFASQSKALYASQSEQYALSAQDTALPAKSYSREGAAPLEINVGANSRVTERGTQYPSASIKTQDEQGWELLIPMAGLQYCNGS